MQLSTIMTHLCDNTRLKIIGSNCAITVMAGTSLFDNVCDNLSGFAVEEISADGGTVHVSVNDYYHPGIMDLVYNTVPYGNKCRYGTP